MASTASIAPPAGSAPIKPAAGGDERCAASARESTPATWAAAISPIECPISRSGLDAERLDQPEEGDLERRTAPAGRTRSRPGARPRASPGREHQLLQRSSEVRVELGANRVEGRGEDRERPRSSSPPMPGTLRALTGEQEGGPARSPARRGRCSTPAPPARPSSRRRIRSSRVEPTMTAHELEVGPPGRQGEGDVERGRARGSPARCGVQPLRLPAQRLRRSWPRSTKGSRAGPRVSRRARGPLTPRRAGRAPLRGSAWALVPLMPNEETPARRGCPPLRPRLGLGQQLAPRPSSSPRAASARSTCRVRGSSACAQRQHHLDHAAHPAPRPQRGRCST